MRENGQLLVQARQLSHTLKPFGAPSPTPRCICTLHGGLYGFSEGIIVTILALRRSMRRLV